MKERSVSCCQQAQHTGPAQMHQPTSPSTGAGYTPSTQCGLAQATAAAESSSSSQPRLLLLSGARFCCTQQQNLRCTVGRRSKNACSSVLCSSTQTEAASRKALLAAAAVHITQQAGPHCTEQHPELPDAMDASGGICDSTFCSSAITSVISGRWS